MGSLSGAVTNSAYPTEYFFSKTQFAASYYRDRGIPNWGSWYLSSAWVGSTSRQDNFAAAATLLTGWYRVGKQPHRFGF